MVAPSALLDLEEVKAHLRTIDDDEDGLIGGLIDAVTSYLDGWSGILGLALVTQTWRQAHDGFPNNGQLRIPLGPVTGTPTISYYDEAGSQQPFSDFHVATDAIGPMIVLRDGASWPTTGIRPDAVAVTWQCGYGDAANVPAAIRQAALLLIGHWYANRETAGASMAEQPIAVSALLAPFRKVGV